MLTDVFQGSSAMWIWLIGGGLVLAAEMALPGAFLLWIGLAAVLTGGIVAAVPLGFWPQILTFTALSVGLSVFARMVLRYGVSYSDRSTLNKVQNRYVGQIVEVAEPITAGRGKVKVGDTLWLAEGPDAAAGTRVRVTGSHGTVLTTEPA